MAREPDTWSVPYRVRFDEAGPDGLVRTSVLLRYAQDVAWQHSTVRGYDRTWYAERDLAWLVRTSQVAVLVPLGVGAELVATTHVLGSRRVWARRGTEFRDAAGGLVATAQIDWVLLDARGAPTRIPAEFEHVFGSSPGLVGLARVDLAAPPPDAHVREFQVRPQELDPMAHVNNAVYADWLDESVAEAGGGAATRAIPRVARLDYAAAADSGALLTAQAWPADAGWSYRVRDMAGPELLRARLEPFEASGDAT
jgi:acyl-CoA thioesterase FadM